MNRPDLMALVGHRVTVTNPRTGSSWIGTLAALGDEPCAVIDEDDGTRFCIPQSFSIIRAGDNPPATVDPGESGPIYTWPNIPPTADPAVSYRLNVEHPLLAKLDGMLATLQAHIDQRAQELARPHIDEARSAAADEVKSAQGMQQRAEDLVAELRRQIRALERRRDEQQQRADQAEAANARVRELHGEIPYKRGSCYCANTWPCPTIRALDGQEPDRG